jgi:sigma-E factor negative regulatory protein RseC
MEPPVVGQVLSVRDGLAVVGVDAPANCARCAAGKGCGAGMIAGLAGARQIELSVANATRLAPGDLVELAMPAADLLRGAVYAYGLPLAGALLALTVAQWMLHPLTDPIAAGAAATGLLSGWLGGRRLLAGTRCQRQLQPEIVDYWTPLA